MKIYKETARCCKDELEAARTYCGCGGEPEIDPVQEEDMFHLIDYLLRGCGYVYREDYYIDYCGNVVLMKGFSI